MRRAYRFALVVMYLYHLYMSSQTSIMFHPYPLPPPTPQICGRSPAASYTLRFAQTISLFLKSHTPTKKYFAKIFQNSVAKKTSLYILEIRVILR
jgi:hypothetical protein